VALKFFTTPNTDAERRAIVAELGANGITCFLRLRGPPREAGPDGLGDSVTLLVPEEQMQKAEQVLAAMPAIVEPPEPFPT
jgi:hypothetical protein